MYRRQVVAIVKCKNIQIHNTCKQTHKPTKTNRNKTKENKKQ